MRRLSLAQGLIGSIFCIWLSAWSVGAKPAARSENILVPAGAEVMVLTKTDLYSNTVFVGDRLTFEVARDVIIDGRVVIAKGAPVEAGVTWAIPRRSFGRGGKLGISVDTVTAVDGQKIKLRAALNAQGDGRTGKALIPIILGSLVGGGMGGVVFGGEQKGGAARIKAGTEIKAETTEEKAVLVGAGRPPAQDPDKNLKDPLLK